MTHTNVYKPRGNNQYILIHVETVEERKKVAEFAGIINDDILQKDPLSGIWKVYGIEVSE